MAKILRTKHRLTSEERAALRDRFERRYAGDPYRPLFIWTGWYGRPTFLGQNRRLNRAVKILIEHIWLTLGLRRRVKRQMPTPPPPPPPDRMG
jgi:hypothetical protein